MLLRHRSVLILLPEGGLEFSAGLTKKIVFYSCHGFTLQDCNWVMEHTRFLLLTRSTSAEGCCSHLRSRFIRPLSPGETSPSKGRSHHCWPLSRSPTRGSSNPIRPLWYVICVYVCMCARMCIGTVCMYVCVYVYIYVCVNVYVCVCVYAYMYICVYICIYVCMYVWVYIRVYVYMCGYACMHVYICMYKYVCICHSTSGPFWRTCSSSPCPASVRTTSCSLLVLRCVPCL